MIPNREIYKGIRGPRFSYFLSQVLSLSNLKPEYMNVLLDKEGLELYDRAFTHKTADDVNNYEYLEFLGDTTLNKSIAWYLSRRFPELNCSSGVKVLTRLKINLISKKSFASFAKQLHFWDFVSADMEVRTMKMDKTLEDVFEAFFGTTEKLVDERIRQGVGYHICYDIIKELLDSKPISLKYNDLFDAKTRLKEIFDYFGVNLGTLKYDSVNENRLHYVEVVVVKGRERTVLGTASSYLKSDAQQKAAEIAIETLQRMGYSKPLDESYKLFCS